MITKPNYTQVPNVLFDKIMENLTGAELKVMLCLCRKIFGWHKEKDKISISQIIKMTGLGKTQIIKSLKTLEKMNLVMSIKEFGRTTEYSLIIEESEPVQKVNRTSSESEQVLAQTGSESEHTKESIKETKQNKEDPMFEFWYNKYNKKVAKDKTFMLWDKLSATNKEKCLKVVDKYVLSTPDKQFRKQPDTYLRNNCWEDEIILSADKISKYINLD